MTTFIISGSIDDSNTTSPALGSYTATVTGTIAIGDTSRTALAALRNNSTDSVDLRLSRVRVSVSPKGTSQANDVCFILGALASGSVSGNAFSATKVDPTYPTSVAGAYGATITGPTLRDPTDGFLVPAQSQNLVWSPNPPIVVANVNDQVLTEDPLVIAPGESYVVSLSQVSVIGGGTPNFAYIVEFGWDEVA